MVFADRNLPTAGTDIVMKVNLAHPVHRTAEPVLPAVERKPVAEAREEVVSANIAETANVLKQKTVQHVRMTVVFVRNYWKRAAVKKTGFVLSGQSVSQTANKPEHA